MCDTCDTILPETRPRLWHMPDRGDEAVTEGGGRAHPSSRRGAAAVCMGVRCTIILGNDQIAVCLAYFDPIPPLYETRPIWGPKAYT